MKSNCDQCYIEGDGIEAYFVIWDCFALPVGLAAHDEGCDGQLPRQAAAGEVEAPLSLSVARGSRGDNT